MFLNHFSEDHTHKLVVESIKTKSIYVEQLRHKPSFTLTDLPALLSPAAQQYLDSFAHRSQALTRQYFGHSIQLFAPLYLSNECYNHCSYCGFGIQHRYERKTLTDTEILREGRYLAQRGFSHILLLTGEAPKTVGVDYISHAIRLLKPLFSSIGVEIQPLSLHDYQQLRHAGADHLTLYQETYHLDTYKKHHLSGFKRDYSKRLIALEDGAKAGFHSINIGALLGLYDWRFEGLSLAQHLNYLMKKYWKTHYLLSFPRITKMVGSFSVPYVCSDADLCQLIFSFRLLFPDCGITLSTREPASLRDGLLPLGISMMSAESSTSPGGYTGNKSNAQFDTHDQRSIHDISTLILNCGLDPMLKNWDRSISPAL